MRLYVDNSTIFDSRPYLHRKIASAIQAAGGTNVRTANNHGWPTQPKVVTFEGRSADKRRYETAVEKALGHSWIIVREKDW